MTDRVPDVLARARRAGYPGLVDYTVELEDIIEAIVDAVTEDDHDLALDRARKIVWSWPTA
jgi:hypothetical protein